MSASRLCQLCHGITGEALVSPNGYKHAPRPEDLGNRGKHSCHLCEHLGMDYVPDWDPDSDVDPDGNSGFSKWDLRLSVTVRDPEVYHLKLTSDIWPGPHEKWQQDMHGHYLMTPTGDPAAQHGIPTMHLELTNTRSAETFDFVRSCIERCDRDHDCTSALELDSLENRKRKLKEVEILRPARLVSLSSEDESSVCLMRVTEENCPQYTTLSHCWGSNMPANCLTTKSNIQARLKPFHIAALPRTFRDAIEITRRLDFQYIFIDTLCIIQDSEEDWAIESVKMGSVYQNSALNIAASHAENSFDGCFNKQSISQVRAKQTSSRERDAIEITGADSDGRDTTLVLYKVPYDTSPDLLEQSPLHKRGWTFQERVLSPRTVHFTSTQVVWECRKEYWFEDRIPWRAHGERRRPMSSILRPDLRDYTKSTPTFFKDDYKIARVTDHWYDRLVADNYSGRLFTKPSDRLVALAGIATVYQQLTKDRYIAGLWESALATGLTWSKLPVFLYKDTKLPRRWPTWSWTSQNDGVRYTFVGVQPKVTVPDPEFELIDVKLKYGPGHVNEFSPVVGGYITVRGCLTDMILENASCRYPQHWHKAWEGHYSLDVKSANKPDNRTVTALLVGRGGSGGGGGDRFLLLEPYEGGDSSYARIGIAEVNYPPFRGPMGQWQETTEEAAQIRAARKPVTVRLY